MKKLKILLVFAIALLTVTAFACGKGEMGEYAESMRASADGAVRVEARVSLTDGETQVYWVERHIEIDIPTRTASVSDTTSTLGENFEMTSTSSTVSVENVTGSSLIGLNLTDELVYKYEITDGNLTAYVSGENVSKVLGKDVSASSDMVLKVSFNGGKLEKAEYTYVNSSSRTVSVTVEYGY